MHSESSDSSEEGDAIEPSIFKIRKKTEGDSFYTASVDIKPYFCDQTIKTWELRL